MSQIYLVPLSVYINQDPVRMIKVFTKSLAQLLGIQWGTLTYEWLYPNFYEYCRGPSLGKLTRDFYFGHIDFDHLAYEIRRRYPQSTFTDAQLVAVCCRMCEVTSITKTAFKEILALQRNNERVHIFQDINPWFNDYIETSSGYQNSIFREREAAWTVEDFRRMLRQHGSNVTFNLFFAPVSKDPYKRFWKLGWLWAPYEKIAYYHIKQEEAFLQGFKADGVNLIPQIKGPKQTPILRMTVNPGRIVNSPSDYKQNGDPSSSPEPDESHPRGSPETTLTRFAPLQHAFDLVRRAGGRSNNDSGVFRPTPYRSPSSTLHPQSRTTSPLYLG